MERINKVFRNGEPLSAEELNGIVRYINELGETIEENLDDWSSLNAVEEMWNSLKEDDDSNRIHNSHSPLSYPLSSINGANLGLPPYSDMTIASDGNGGWLWKKVNQGGGGGGSSSLLGINKLRTYFLNVAHGIVPSAPSVNNYNSSPQDNFTNGQDVWTFTNTNPTNDLDTYAIWVWFLSNTPVNIDGPIKIFDGAINSSNGEDGEEIEWIYRRVSIIPSETTLNSWENTLANCIGNASAQDGKTFENADAIPFDWYDNPQGVTNAEKYEYASFRRSVNGSDGKRIWGTTGFCRPFIWSTYGEKGMDGDGVEYIFWGKAEAVTNWTTFSQNQENASNYPPGWTNNEGFLDKEYTGPSGSLWSDDSLGINSTTRRYIYMSKRKKVQNPLTGISSWESFSIPVLWSQFADLPNDGINGAYILEVYRNDSAALLANLSNIPSSNNRDYPPTGWTTSPQERSSNQFTWCMQRTMGYDEYNHASPGAWGTPFRLTGDNGNDGEDGKYTEFIYKHFTSELTFTNDINNPNTWSTTNNNLNSPDNPLREDYTGPSGNKWSDNPQGVDDTYIYEYMCQRTFDGNSYGAFTNPVIWSKYGLNGRDGDGFEYIFKGFSSEQTSWNTNSDDYPPKWITSEASAFLGDDYLGPTGHTWADDAIGVDDTNNKFVYVCSRKKYVDLGASRATWHTFSTPKLWAQYVPPGGQGPQGPNGAFTLFIFKNSSLDLSTSGNYNELSTSTSSIPTGWSLTATNPSSSEYIWGSHRLITYNTSNEAQYGAWVTPYRISGNDGNAANGGHYEFRYKNYATLPNAPTGTGNTDGWSSSPSTPSASEKYTWMSLTYVSGTSLYGTWSTPIRLTGEDGQPGTDGNSIEFIYTRNNTGIAPAAPPNGTYPNDWSGTDSNGVVWADNPLGVASNMMWEYVCQRVKLNGTWGNYEPNPAAVWSKWGEKGQDGDGYEYIYILTADTTAPNTPSTSPQTDNYVPTGWTADPSSVSLSFPYQWCSVRKRISGTWGSWGTPALWSRYAEQGETGGHYEFRYKNASSLPNAPTGTGLTDSWSNTPSNPNISGGEYTWMSQSFVTPGLNGTSDTYGTWTTPIRITGGQGEDGADGTDIEFIYTRNNTGTAPSTPATSQVDDDVPTGWTDNPQGVQADMMYEYVSMRYKRQGVWTAFTTPVIWSKWGEKGMDGDGYEYIYKLTATADVPTNPTPSSTSTTEYLTANYVPTGWSDDPGSVSESTPYQWVCIRERHNGTWSTFSTPALWARWASPGSSGGHYEFRYKNNATQPNAPTGTGESNGWSRTPTSPTESEKYTWMSQTYVNGNDEYGTWSTPIRLTGEKGDTGADGTDIEFIYTRNNTGTAPSAPATTQTDDWYGTDSNNVTWTDSPQGVLSNLMYEYVSVRYKRNDTWGAYSTPVIWSKWGEKGLDGDGYEYIYKATSSSSSPGNPTPNDTSSSTYQTNGYVPTGWSGDPTSISSSEAYLWASVRKKTNGTWGSFSNPALWSHYATSTAGTSTVVYQLVATVSEIRYKRNHAGIVVWMPSTFNLKLYQFQGTTFDNISLPSGYYVLRIIDGTNSASTSLGTINASDLASYTSNGDPVIGERVTIELRDSDDEVHAVLNLSIVREFLRMLIPVGAYVSKRYDMTDTTVPLVLGSNGKYYYLDADTNEVSNTYVDPTTANQTVWGEASEYEVILTKALFADFAKLGSFVVYDKYFFSLFGYLYNSDGSYSIINTSSAAPAAYANFDPNDPMVNTLPSSGHLKFRPAKIIDAETGEEWGANGNIHIGTDGSVSIKGDILATSLVAGSTSGLNITTTGTAINFNEGNDTRAYFTSELSGLLLYIKNPSDGVWYKIDFSKWYNTQQLNVTFISNTFFTVNSTTNSINVSDVISLTTLYLYNNEWYTTASTTGNLPRTDIKYYRRVPVDVFEDDSTKMANFPCLLHRGELTISYSESSSSSTETCYYAMDFVYAFIETEYNSSTHKMTDTGYVFYVAYGGNSSSGPTGGPVTYYYETRYRYGGVYNSRANSSSSPLFLMFDTSHNNDNCEYIYNGTLRTNTTYPYWTIYTPMKLILYLNQIGSSSTINTIRTNLAPTLLENDYGSGSYYNFMDPIDSDYSSNVSEAY